MTLLKIPLMGPLGHLNSATAIVVMFTIAITKNYWTKVVFQTTMIKYHYKYQNIQNLLTSASIFHDFTTDERLLHCVGYLRVSSQNRSENKWSLSRHRYTDGFICLLEQLAVLFDDVRTFIAYLWTTCAIYFVLLFIKKTPKPLETMPLTLYLFYNNEHPA